MRQMCSRGLKCHVIYRLAFLALTIALWFICLSWYNACMQKWPCQSGAEDEMKLVNSDTRGASTGDEIDAVYTWVNGSDENLIDNIIKYQAQVLLHRNLTIYSYLPSWTFADKCILGAKYNDVVNDGEKMYRESVRREIVNLPSHSSSSSDVITDGNVQDELTMKFLYEKSTPSGMKVKRTLAPSKYKATFKQTGSHYYQEIPLGIILSLQSHHHVWHSADKRYQMVTRRVKICQGSTKCRQERATLVYFASTIDQGRIVLEVERRGHRLLPLFLRIPCDPFDSLDTGESNSRTSIVSLAQYSLTYIENWASKGAHPLAALTSHIARLTGHNYTSGDFTSTDDDDDGRRLIFWPFRSVSNESNALIFSPTCDNLSSDRCERTSFVARSKLLRASSTLHTNAQMVVGDEYLLMSLSSSSQSNDQISRKRFTDNGELRYSLRSLSQFAPWIRYVYLVTNGQIPNWLRTDHPKLRIVTHEDIFVNKSHLPTFSSPAIESHLHRIPGLSNRFIYINDDIIFGAPVYPETFYTRDEGYKIYLTWPVPDCATGCPSNWLGDGFCDVPCNTEVCGYDSGDCLSTTTSTTVDQMKLYNFDHRPMSYAQYQQAWCSPGCPNAWLGDDRCDTRCNTTSCAYDLADCLSDEVIFDVNYTRIDLPIPQVTASDISVNTSVTIDQLDGIYINISALTTLYNASSFAITRLTYSPKFIMRSYKNNFNLQSILMSLNSRAIKFTNEAMISLEITFYPRANNSSTVSDSTVDTVTSSTSMKYVSERWMKQFVLVTINVMRSNDTQEKEDEEGEMKKERRRMQLMSSTSEKTRATGVRDASVKDEEILRHTTKLLEKVSSERRVTSVISMTSSNIEDSKSNLHARVRRSVTTLKDESTFHCSSSGVCNSSKQNMQDEMNSEIEIEDEARVKLTVKLEDVHSSQIIEKKSTNSREREKEGAGKSVSPSLNLSDRQIDASELHYEVKIYEESLERAGASFRQKEANFDVNLMRKRRGATSPVEGQEGGGGDVDARQNGGRSIHPVRVAHQSHLPGQSMVSDEYRANVFQSRHLLDIYADSLRYVNKLYNEKFTSRPRKVPGHMAHMIDKSIMSSMIDEFHQQFDLTSRHKFRSTNDMQFAFSYFYYLINQQYSKNVSSILSSFDSDDSGKLSGNELHTLMASVVDAPLTKSSLEAFTETIRLCTLPLANVSFILSPRLDIIQVSPEIPLEILSGPQCSQLHSRLIKLYGTGSANKFRIVSSDDIADDLAFVMVTSNATLLQSELNALRRKPVSFICLNDDIDYSSLSEDDLTQVQSVLNAFYSYFFPHKSPFELPDGQTNDHLYVSPYRLRQAAHVKSAKESVSTKNIPPFTCWSRLFVASFLSTLLILILCNLIKARVYGAIVRWLTRH